MCVCVYVCHVVGGDSVRMHLNYSSLSIQCRHHIAQWCGSLSNNSEFEYPKQGCWLRCRSASPSQTIWKRPCQVVGVSGLFHFIWSVESTTSTVSGNFYSSLIHPQIVDSCTSLSQDMLACDQPWLKLAITANLFVTEYDFYFGISCQLKVWDLWYLLGKDGNFYR